MLALNIQSNRDPNHTICPKIDDFNFIILDLIDFYLIALLIFITLIIIIHNKIIAKNNKYNLNK